VKGGNCPEACLCVRPPDDLEGSIDQKNDEYCMRVVGGVRAFLAKRLGVSHLLHPWWPNHLRAFLDKIGNVQGEVFYRLVYLNVVLPGLGRPDPVVVFLQPP
jgi:hypothetical protein